MRKSIITLAVFSLIVSSAAMASAVGVPWKNHDAPFDFLFGNHIDTHQQTMPMPDGSLFGFLYITFTGDYTEDGVPIARHADANDPMIEVSVGWQVRAVPAVATAVYHQTGDHPIWLIDDRDDIPHPGGFSHFHWLDGPAQAKDLVIGETYDGYVLELTGKDTFAFRHGGELVYISIGLDLASHLNIVTSFPGFTDDSGGGTGH